MHNDRAFYLDALSISKNPIIFIPSSSLMLVIRTSGIE